MKLYHPTINEMLNTPEYDAYISDKLGNDLFISDPDRADRIHEAAENGSDGSTHAEHIEDWRDFLNYYERLPERCKDYLRAEIDQVEKWHEEHGTLYEVIV